MSAPSHPTIELFPGIILSGAHNDSVFFDADGPLFNSDPPIDNAVATKLTAALQTKGRHSFVHTAAANAARFHGRAFPDILAEVARENDVTFEPDEVDALNSDYEREKCRVLRLETLPAPGIEALLEKLQAAGVRLAIVSSSTRDALNACLDCTGLKRFFLPDFIFSAVDSLPHPAPKPRPDIYRFAHLVAAGHAPARTIVIEDTPTGIRAAHKAKLEVAAFGGCLAPDQRAAHREQCFAEGAFAYISSYDELLARIAA